MKSKVDRQTDRRQLIPSELKSLDKVRMRIYIGGGEEGRREGMEKGGRRGGGEKGGNGEGSDERGEKEERREEAGGNHIKHKLVEKNLHKKHNCREKTLKSKVYRQTTIDPF